MALQKQPGSRSVTSAKPAATKPGRSSAASAYDLLLESIENGELPPGARLREAELATRFQISRTPVREALKRLETQGLVGHEPHHGSVVASIDYGKICELYMMREVLEGTAARMAAQYATPEEIDILYGMVESDRDLVGDGQKLARTNRLFHAHIRRAARNRYLNQTLENFRLSLALLAGTALQAPGRGEQSNHEHQLLVNAIAARKSEEAEEIARNHVRNALKTRIRLFDTSPP